jgi:hypothetical protein
MCLDLTGLNSVPETYFSILSKTKQTKPDFINSITETWPLSTKKSETWGLRDIICYFTNSRRLGKTKNGFSMLNFSSSINSSPLKEIYRFLAFFPYGHPI